MKTHIFAFTLSIVLCLTARAGLKWDQTSIELHPAATDKQAIGHFKYQNTGDKPVKFKSVKTSCGCTAAQTQKEEVPPGEKGEITVEIAPTFVFWGQGEEAKSKTIVVRAAKDFPVKHLKVTSSSPDFQTKVEETGNGQFKIDVKPQETNKQTASTLTIQPEDSQKIFYATARITNAPPVPQ